jgi:hypothetical protein
VHINDISKYKINENSVVTDADKIHINNYKQLITFFEESIRTSVGGGKTNYDKLLEASMQTIRYLDNLIMSYETSIQSARTTNKVIDKIIEENSPKKKLKESNLKDKEILEKDQ